jgi:hypothetical protein
MHLGTDSFTRADADPITQWTIAPSSNAVKIVSNKVRPSVLNNGCVAYLNSAVLAPDQFAAVTAVTLTADTIFNKIKAAARIHPSAVETCYEAGIESTTGFGAAVNIVTGKRVAGLYTELSTTTGTVNANDRIRIEVIGTLVVGYVNDVLKTSATDTAIPTPGHVGIGLSAFSDLSFVEVDDFLGGDLVASSHQAFPKPNVAEAVTLTYIR